MPDLTDILAQALGCTPGARGCLTHGHTWPCDHLTDTVGEVMEWHEAEVNREVGAALTALAKQRPAPPPSEVECCASGRCEVCSPIHRWMS